MYCSNCGAEVNDSAVICVKCGCALNGEHSVSLKEENSNRALIALLLAVFAGHLGAHRFYTGKTGTGIALLCIFLFTFWTLLPFVWQIVDIIMILSGNFTDKDGRYLKL